jgi:ankyrin repeat protein
MPKRWIVLLVLLAIVPLQGGSGKVTREEALKRLKAEQRDLTGQGLLESFEYRNDESVDLLKMYLAIGIPADKLITYEASDGEKHSAYPLNYLLRYACDDPRTTELVKILTDAGADVNVRDDEENGRTAVFKAVRCPEILKVVLAHKPDLTIRDKSGNNVMSTAISEGEPPAVSVKMLLDAGFDPKPFLKDLRQQAGHMPEVLELLGGKKSSVASGGNASGRTAAVTDWKALPPYPSRTAEQAKKALARPGADISAQDHFWDAITSKEPLRLALALTAGADVRATRSVTGYAPLVLLAERCDRDSDAAQQAAVATMLLEAGADRTAVDANHANALTMAAHGCPVEVVRALIQGGLPLAAVSSTGDTPLRAAILAGRADVVAALLEAGVDPKKEPYNVRKLASGNSEIEALLKKKK